MQNIYQKRHDVLNAKFVTWLKYVASLYTITSFSKVAKALKITISPSKAHPYAVLSRDDSYQI